MEKIPGTLITDELNRRLSFVPDEKEDEDRITEFLTNMAIDTIEGAGSLKSVTVTWSWPPTMRGRRLENRKLEVYFHRN